MASRTELILKPINVNFGTKPIESIRDTSSLDVVKPLLFCIKRGLNTRNEQTDKIIIKAITREEAKGLIYKQNQEKNSK